MHAVLKHHHIVIGVEFHIPWPIFSPAPLPSPWVNATVCDMYWTGAVCTYAASSYTQAYGYTMNRGTDIGLLIPHITIPHFLLPLDILLSSSKSHFGPSNIKAGGAPIAAALAVCVNPNLACGTPVPTPLTFVFATNTHYVKMSLADIVYGLLSMAVDWVIQWAIGKFVDWGAGKITQKLMPAMMSKTAAKSMLRAEGNTANRAINTAARAYVDNAAERGAAFVARIPFFSIPAEAANPIVNTLVSNAMGFVIGGPLGADAGSFGLPTPGGALTDAAQGGTEGLFNPSSPPAPPPQTYPVMQNYLNQPGVEDVVCTYEAYNPFPTGPGGTYIGPGGGNP